MKTNVFSKSGLVLSIEAAVRGGSIALLELDRKIAVWHGIENVSRAEDLLLNISKIFDRTNIDKKRLDFIAVSNGPGSYTGIRIGLATALGLARALKIPCLGIPLLSAIAEPYGEGTNCLVAIPIRRNELCWQKFDKSGLAEMPRTGSAQNLIENFQDFREYRLLMQHDAFETVSNQPGFEALRPQAINLGRDLALSLGIGARNRTPDLTPNYVRNPQFSSSPI